MPLTRTRHGPDDPALADVLALIRDSFAYMEGRIDPPSSVHALTLDSLRAQAATSEIWSLGPPPCACAIFTPQPGALYIGKLCVARAARGQGLSRDLVDLACARARLHGAHHLELQTRVELTGNHAAFAALGFAEVARTAHPGFDRPTSIRMRRPVG